MAINCVLIEWLNPADKDVTDSSKWVIRNKDYKPDFLPVVGLEPQYEVFVKRTPFVLPPVDYRLFDLVISESPLDIMDEEHTSNRQWAVTYSIQDKDIEEKNTSVEEAMNLANEIMFPQSKRELIQLAYPVVKARELAGLTIGVKQQKIIDSYELFVQRAYENFVIAEQKKEDISNGIAIDVDADFNTQNPENETNP